jgi:hypothetical protein
MTLPRFSLGGATAGMTLAATLGCASFQDARQDAGPNAGAMPMPCPTSVPAENSPCMGFTPDCEYGGDQLGRCTTLLRCTLDDGGTLGWHVQATPCPDIMNDPKCPPTIDALHAGAPCPATGKLGCEYNEGRCGCECSGDQSVWQCRKRNDVPVSVAGMHITDGSVTCNTTRPRAGTACTTANQICSYDAPCTEELGLGPSLGCVEGTWRVATSAAVCTPATCSAAK